MSYNEKISKFMSLMGPFYEVVSSDDTDSQKGKSKFPTFYYTLDYDI